MSDELYGAILQFCLLFYLHPQLLQLCPRGHFWVNCPLKSYQHTHLHALLTCCHAKYCFPHTRMIMLSSGSAVRVCAVIRYDTTSTDTAIAQQPL